jgi:SAM-dependent methyltransferase
MAERVTERRVWRHEDGPGPGFQLLPGFQVFGQHLQVHRAGKRGEAQLLAALIDHPGELGELRGFTQAVDEPATDPHPRIIRGVASQLADFVRWLDVIPGRNWLVVGYTGNTLSAEIQATLPAGVTKVDVLEAEPWTLPFEAGTYDVALTLQWRGRDLRELLEELKRVVVPGGIIAACLPQSQVGRGELMRLFKQAGLHAVQSRDLAPAAAKGIR